MRKFGWRIGMVCFFWLLAMCAGAQGKAQIGVDKQVFNFGTIEEAKGEAVLKSVNPGQQFTKIVYDKLTDALRVYTGICNAGH